MIRGCYLRIAVVLKEGNQFNISCTNTIKQILQILIHSEDTFCHCYCSTPAASYYWAINVIVTDKSYIIDWRYSLNRYVYIVVWRQLSVLLTPLANPSSCVPVIIHFILRYSVFTIGGFFFDRNKSSHRSSSMLNITSFLCRRVSTNRARFHHSHLFFPDSFCTFYYSKVVYGITSFIFFHIFESHRPPSLYPSSSFSFAVSLRRLRFLRHFFNDSCQVYWLSIWFVLCARYFAHRYRMQ